MNRSKVFELAKGFRGRSKNCFRIAKQSVEKALQYAYRDRRNKKRDMRGLWIERINAGSREHGVKYSEFIHGLNNENVQLNRKVLSELAMYEPYSFKALVDLTKSNQHVVPSSSISISNSISNSSPSSSSSPQSPAATISAAANSSYSSSPSPISS